MSSGQVVQSMELTVEASESGEKSVNSLNESVLWRLGVPLIIVIYIVC